MSKKDLQLLQDYEPILRFSGGERQERFYPIRVSDYLQKTSLHRIKDSGPLRWLRARRVTEGWDGVQEREQSLGNFAGEAGYAHFLSFKPAKPADDERAVRLRIGIAGLVLLFAVLACGWWGYTLGQAGSLWASRIVLFLAALVFIVAVVLLLQAFGISAERFSRGGDVILGMLIGGLFLTLLPLVLGLWTCSGILVFIFALLLLSQGEQLAAFALALISPIGEKEAASAHCTCQNWEPIYYGRVRRDGQEIVLQYFFFYALNEWRYHGGFNNHQGDWEGTFVFLQEVQGQANPVPQSVGVSQHHLGEVLPWDAVDKETVKGQEHPVIYVAAGSHANYPEGGETLLEDIVSSDKDSWGYKIARLVRKWREGEHVSEYDLMAVEERVVKRKRMYRQEMEDLTALAESELVVAREHHAGDGRIIGPSGYETGQPFVPWPQPVLLDDQYLPGWIEFRGLWGIKTLHKDESGPPGPKWEREGHTVNKRDEPFLKDCKRCRLYWVHPWRWREKVQEFQDSALSR